MRTAALPIQAISIDANASSAPTSNKRPKQASPDTSSTVSGAENSDATIRLKRSPIQQEPRQNINESWPDFQQRHYEWAHPGRSAKPGAIPPDEGRLQGPKGWPALLEWVTSLIFGGPVLPEGGVRLPLGRAAFREAFLTPKNVERVFVGEDVGAPVTEINEGHASAEIFSPGIENHPHLPAVASRPEGFELKNLDTGRLKQRFNVSYRPGENQEYVQIDGKWYASAEEQGERFVYKPNEDGVASTWPIREVNDEWHFTPLNELPSRPLSSVERIPAGYRVGVPTGLQEADALGIYRAAGQEYIKIDGSLYRSGQDASGRYIYDGNPTHRIAVQRSEKGWAITPPSRGLGGAPLTPVEVVQNVFNMTEAEALDYLSQYRFDDSGAYTELNFGHELNDTQQVPGWAERFRVDASASHRPAIPAHASQPAPAGGMDVVNPISGQRIHIDEGGYLNSAGFIERTDIPQVYRAIDSVNAGRNDPTKVGFHKSYRFNAVPKMVRGAGLIGSTDQHGPDFMFGVWDQWLDHYAIYRIDTMGLKCVSLQENMKSNPGVMEKVFNLSRGVLAEINAISDEAVRTGLLDDFTRNAYSANEVHVENEQLNPARISFEEGSITYDIDSEEGGSSPDSARTWSPPPIDPSTNAA